MRTLIAGASNIWFPAVISSLAIPTETGRLQQLIEEAWDVLEMVTAPNILGFLRSTGQLKRLVEYPDEEIWVGIEAYRDRSTTASEPDMIDLKAPEWQVFSSPDPALNGQDFRLKPVESPSRFAAQIERVVLVERLREVRAMIGFTRLDAAGELTDPDLGLEIDPAPLSRRAPTWVPANEVRGEGIFIQFREEAIARWLARPAVQERAGAFVTAHRQWRQVHGLDPEAGFPGMRYILIHTFSHLLMRQLALESGYSAASIRERIYARDPEMEGGPMAGCLLYTAAPDSEGTLGGLVSLGDPDTLERHITAALEAARLCANDPLCAERAPSIDAGRALHAAACHACAFTSETSCERGNKYLDRSLLIPTIEQGDLAFFA